MCTLLQVTTSVHFVPNTSFFFVLEHVKERPLARVLGVFYGGILFPAISLYIPCKC